MKLVLALFCIFASLLNIVGIGLTRGDIYLLASTVVFMTISMSAGIDCMERNYFDKEKFVGWCVLYLLPNICVFLTTILFNKLT